jgi:hypothetical protein
MTSGIEREISYKVNQTKDLQIRAAAKDDTNDDNKFLEDDQEEEEEETEVAEKDKVKQVAAPKSSKPNTIKAALTNAAAKASIKAKKSELNPLWIKAGK